MSESEVLRQEPQFAAWVGIDWADQKHAWCLQAAGTTQRESGEVEHTPEAVEAWIGQLCQRFGNRPIAVAVKQAKEALVFNGFALFFVAGKIGWLLTRADIWRRSPSETHRWLRSPLGQSCEIFVDTL